ncbi:hypothetical protein THAOC_32953 [Thalassiosira oceanica]|uniref:Uncharacterized protein n=1 Tax=Thalassiosira oceanica TaxID=159749 RepID=K0RH90_THAOC|nr:hypothetical protein THAOC_32953 [Thalassiosira oceanica]|eukprot:EJK48266.1 hypothetical protein THAOC_32953 [Thalassiosira oceanica]
MQTGAKVAKEAPGHVQPSKTPGCLHQGARPPPSIPGPSMPSAKRHKGPGSLGPEPTLVRSRFNRYAEPLPSLSWRGLPEKCQLMDRLKDPHNHLIGGVSSSRPVPFLVGSVTANPFTESKKNKSSKSPAWFP